MIRRRTRCPKKNKPIFRVVVTLIIVFLIAIGSLYFFTPRNFKNLTNFNVVINGENGDLEVVNFNSQNSEITQLTIPRTTQLSVSRQLGSWKAMSLWQLGINENISGRLLQETVLKNFSFPVTAWADREALGFIDNNFFSIFKSVTFPYKSNMNWGDKLKLAILSLKLVDRPVTHISLADTPFLKKVKLIDGEDGFIVSGDISPKIAAIFAEDKFSRRQVRVLIKNQSSNLAVVDNIGKVIEVLGAKVAASSKDDPADFDCQVKGSDAPLVLIFSSIFACDKLSTSPQGNFDIEIDLGERFARRY